MQTLAPAQLRRRCDPAELAFQTTADLPAPAGDEDVLGQERALEALRFALDTHHPGYNVFALGPPGHGKHTVVRRVLERRAADAPRPPDWVYVNDFDDFSRPRALRLPPGRGVSLKTDLARFVGHVLKVLPAAFEGEEYRVRLRALEKTAQTRREQALAELESRARRRDLAVVRTPMGIGVAPLVGGKVLEPDAFAALPEAEQQRLRAGVEGFQDELSGFVEALPGFVHDHQREVEELNREVAHAAVARLVAELRERWADSPEVRHHLDAIEKDVVDNVREFVGHDEGGPGGPVAEALRKLFAEGPYVRRYAVNVLVDRDEKPGAPVVYEDHPTLARLVGRIEHRQQMGVLLTDVTLLRAGALHQASGGYLVLDAHKLLSQPFAWDALKRALRAREIRFESPSELLSLSSAASIEPAPIPVDVKVVLVGDRELYYLLADLDPEFLELFKVAADFDERTDREGGGPMRLARLCASIVRAERLLPVEQGGVARLVEEAARLADDAGFLSTSTRALADLLREADGLARAAGRRLVGAADVDAARAAQVRRQDRVPSRVREAIRRGDLLVGVRGQRTGQLNGLTVVRLGDVEVGFPTRITARVRLGRGEVVDIEREAALGGPLHSKGMLILAGYLGGRYGRERPLAFGASLVFEQSYGHVDGDSASAAELIALLSALAEVPLAQSLAITGSIDQLGHIQPIGAVNAKIEGFYDACREIGLSGEQGVVIPAANMKHLMLREDVVEAVAKGTFKVVAVETIDEAVALFTGLEAREVDRRVEARLDALAEKVRAFGRAAEQAKGVADDRGAD